MTELVLAVNREELHKQNILNQGLYHFKEDVIDTLNYAFVSRKFAGNKSPKAILFGSELFAQVICYMQLTNEQDQIMLFQRKSKDGILEGKWSIGVGGHVSHEDLLKYAEENHTTNMPEFFDLFYAGTMRELEEETNLDPNWLEPFADVQDFTAALKTIISTDADVTSQIHVGFPLEVRVPDHSLPDIDLDPDEFLNVSWVSKNELVAYLNAGTVEFETWTKILIESYAKEQKDDYPI